MPSYVLKTPNEKFAIFSSVVDDFTWIDLTQEELMEAAVEQWGQKVAIEKVERGLADEPLWKDPTEGDGLNRWRDACESIALQHGLKHLRMRMDEMGLQDHDFPQSAVEMAMSVEADMDPESERLKARL